MQVQMELKMILMKNMLLYHLVISLSLVAITNSQVSKYPCAFIDTVNITGSYPHEVASEQNATSLGSSNMPINISYIYQWMIVPPELIAVYDFVIENRVRIPTERHLRACVCKLKPCIRFCCQPGFYYDLDVKNCLPTNSTDPQLTQDSFTIHFGNESTALVTTSTHFLIHHGTPCDNMSLRLKDKKPVNWILYDNGTIAYKNFLFPKHYCYSSLPDRDKSESNATALTWHWQPLSCIQERFPFVLEVREWTYAICLIITVICMIIILFVYLLCTEMRNTFYGVAIKSYALCIIIGYSLLAHLTLTDPAHMSKYSCSKIPSFALLYIILSFYILSFISFNFYLSFFGIILSKLMFWFIFFPIVLVVACWSFFVSFDYYNNKPVFGNDTCWFDPRNFSIVVYLYAPIILACIFNGIFYILSLLRMSEGLEGGETCINKLIAPLSRNRFKSFWKFYGYTLISWLVCMISFAINYYRDEKTHINYVVCLFVAFHGFGSLYALIGKNNQIQNFLRRIEEEADNDDVAEISVPMRPF
ncbi:probable G-protein coupled receptor Mth-like 8 [Lucilia sericata]|uniref:probable G-protein coupled receptor Mth-like 8 n=1 Tax=Lucilia sericata TaxID=13632 RepID=UPI0018A86B9B|nr:probable G-protein coupled receptor Mth-like 8 [Lucilia sericata]XP_037811137.1 probable G-protein coupled receptor Mth-like 8 [Lucilia sericata]